MSTAMQTVVVVDPSTVTRELFNACAAQLEIDLKTYPSAADAMAFLKKTKPDLLLMDIMLPDKDGLTFLCELRGNALHRETAVIMITEKDYAQDRRIAKELGALEFIPKPMGIKKAQELLMKFSRAEAKKVASGSRG